MRTPRPKLSGWQAYRARRRELYNVELGRKLSAAFAEPISGNSRDLKKTYRWKLGATLTEARIIPFPTVIKSVEGIGKTSGLRATLLYEALEHAMGVSQANADDNHDTYNKQSFAAFAFRSRQQTEKKAKEFREANVPTMVVLPFWEHLRAVCRGWGSRGQPRRDSNVSTFQKSSTRYRGRAKKFTTN